MTANEIATANELLNAIADALGLPMTTQSFSLDFHVCEVPTVTVRQLVTSEQFGKLFEIITQYELTKIEERKDELDL